MKFSLFKNDKSTYLDELFLALFIIVTAGCGVALFIIRPEVLFIKQTESTVFGVLLIITGVMFIPGLIYRLFTNDK